MVRPGAPIAVLAILVAGVQPATAGLERSVAHHRGRVLVLNFWATWCVPCRQEIPLLVRIQQRYGASGVQVVGASIDEPEYRDATEAFVHQMGINYPVWYSCTTADMKPFRLATSIPATAIFDRDGRLAFRIIGQVGESDIVSRLEWLLGDRQTEAPSALALPAEITPEHFAEHERGEEEDEERHGHRAEGGDESEGGSAVPT